MQVLVIFVIAASILHINGNQQCESGPVDLVFVFDQSGSILPPDYELGKDAIARLVERMNVGESQRDSRIGFVLFDEEASVAFDLTAFKTNTDVAAKIRSLEQSRGSTDIAKGMDKAIREVFARETDRGATRIMILITDGQDEGNVRAEQILAKEKKIAVYAFGIGDASANELTIATGSASKVFTVPNYSLLQSEIHRICDEVFPVIAPIVHVPRSCECNYKHAWLDLIFIIDSSAAVSTQDFNGIRNFLTAFVQSLPVSQKIGKYSRIAIIEVGEKALVIADLKKFEDKISAARAFRAMTHLKEPSVNMHDALREAQNMIDADERKEVQNVVVVVTSNPIDCTQYRRNKVLFSKAQLKESNDPCRLSAHIRESGNIIITIAMKFDGINNFPLVDINSPCFSLNYNVEMAKHFTDLLCKANCYCPKTYNQFKDDDKCVEYGECIYLQGVPLNFVDAVDTCASHGMAIIDVPSGEKDKFMQEEEKYMKYEPYWIGAFEVVNGQYQWVTGANFSSADYTNWGEGQPNPSKGKCIVARSTGNAVKWYSEKCDDWLTINYFSCQMKSCDTENYCI